VGGLALLSPASKISFLSLLNKFRIDSFQQPRLKLQGKLERMEHMVVSPSRRHTEQDVNCVENELLVVASLTPFHGGYLHDLR